MKPIAALVVFIAGLVTGTALTWLALRPPGTARPTSATPAAPALDGARVGAGGGAGVDGGIDGDDDEARGSVAGEMRAPDERGATESPVGVVEVARAEIVDHGAWAKQGFVEMVPPVRLPSDGEGRDKIEVWLRVPDGARIRGKQLDDGRATIVFPPGTVADRVESWGYAKDAAGAWLYSVTDVRGTRLDPNGQEMFHVFTPTGSAPRERLIGWEWPRGDELQQRAATSLLLSHLETLRTIQDRGHPQSAAERRKIIDDFRRNNDCAKCHAYDKPVQIARARGIHRATDANGFYVTLSVLQDTLPLERHRVRDMNVGDPFLVFTCPRGDGPVLAEGAGGAREYRCLEGGAPSATLDVVRALAANDPRTVALCRSRAYLRERMDDDARALFARAFTACAL